MRPLAAAGRRAHLRKDAAGAILYSAEKATWMAGEAIQCLGGNGYINDYPTGRLWRDAKLYEIGAGTSEIRRMLIGRELFAETLTRRVPRGSAPADQAAAIAQAILAGFDRHYGLFRYNAQQAKARFEAADWHAIRSLARERITFYDERVREAVDRIEPGFGTPSSRPGNWQHVKRALRRAARRSPPARARRDLLQLGLREAAAPHRTSTTTSSSCARRCPPTTSTAEPPAYRAYYPAHAGLDAALRR